MAINAAEKITRAEFVEFALPIFKAASAAKIAGTNVTLSVPAGAKPEGWPRGELLSVNEDGFANYSYDPEKILKWIEETKEQLPD